MPEITIFKDHESAHDILDKLICDGLVGVSGGRLAVRNKLGVLQSLIDAEELDNYFARSTINHPDTELGYGCDLNRYNLQEAKKIVTKSFDAQSAKSSVDEI